MSYTLCMLGEADGREEASWERNIPGECMGTECYHELWMYFRPGEFMNVDTEHQACAQQKERKQDIVVFLMKGRQHHL